MGKQKESSSRSRSAIGKQNRKAGKELERAVVQNLQAILEPELHRKMEQARAKLVIPTKMPKEQARSIRSEATTELLALQKHSAIRRGEQGRGAHEPDVVNPTTWWLELTRKKDPNAVQDKLTQGQRDLAAARDVGKSRTWSRVAAIHRKTGSPIIRVALRLEDLMDALGEPITPWTTPQWSWDLPVVIEYDRFLKLVETEYVNGQG